MKSEVLQFIIGLVALSALLFGFLLAKVEEVKKNKAKNLIYILLAGLILGISGLLRFAGMEGKPVFFFIALQVAMLIAGIVHATIMKKLLTWPFRNSFTGEFLLTLVISSLGSALLLLNFSLTGMKNFEIILISAVIWFFVPFLFIKSLHFRSNIPAKQFKTWSYPLDHPLADPTDAEMAAPMVISFEFRKKSHDPEDTIFRAKAPKDIQFGRLFYFFINDYNNRHPEGTIEVANGKSDAHSWVFHFKPKAFTKTRYLDPDETVFHNSIKENSVIVCYRMIEK
jgi:hypothetical protein